jgi:anti-sigma factor RsiW
MPCEFSQLLSAYHDGELDSQARENVQRHLSSCPACAAELAGLAEMSQIFASTEQPRLSQFAGFRLRRHAESLVESQNLRLVRVVRAVAACVLAGASIWLWATNGAPAASDQPIGLPPQLDVAVAATVETQSLDTTTPAAAGYLADINSRSDDYPAGE